MVVVVSVWEFSHSFPKPKLVHSTPNWLIVSLQSKFELRASIFLLKSHHCGTFKRELTLFSFNPRKQQHSWESLAVAFTCWSYSQAVRDFAALKLALPSKPSCLKVSIPLIAMITNQVGYPDQSIWVWWYAISPDNPVSHLVEKRTPHWKVRGLPLKIEEGNKLSA